MINWEDFKNLLNKTTEEPFSEPNTRRQMMGQEM